MLMKKKTIMLSDKVCYVLIFVFVVILHEVLNLFFETLCSLPTEMASLGIAAYVAGYDWSSLLADTDYYGNGFYFLMAPLLNVIENTYVFHQVTLFIVVLINWIPSVLCYKLMKRSIDNNMVCLLTAIIVSLLDVVTTVAATNEHPLKLIIWLCLYMLIELINEERRLKRWLYSFFVAILLAYSITVHERALALVCVISVTVVLFLLLFKKCIVNLPIFYGTLLGGYVLSRKAVNFIVKLLWVSDDGSELRNSNGTIGKILGLVDELFSSNGIEGFFNTIMSQLFAGNMYSLGVLAIILCVTFLIFKDALMGAIRKTANDQVKLQEQFVIACVCVGTAIGTVCANAVLNIEAAKILIAQNTGAKFYFFLRYYFIYLSPMFMLVIVYVYEFRERILKCKSAIALINLVNFFYIIKHILPTTFENPSIKLDPAYYIAAFVGREYGEAIAPRHIWGIIIVVTIVYMIMFYLWKKNKYTTWLAIFTCLCAYQYTYIVFTYNMGLENRNYEYINSFISEVYLSEEYRDNVDDIAVVGSTFMAQIAQYEMKEKNIYQGVYKC